MTHHRWSMQTGLSVEQHRVSIYHMTMHNITILQANGTTVHIAQGDVFTILLFQYLGTRINFRAILYQFHQVITVAIIRHYRFGNIHGDFLRHTQLSNRQIGITRDDRAGAEIHTFSHKIASDTSIFTIQTTHDTLQRATRALRHRHCPLDFIIYNHRHKILKNLGEIFNHIG